MEAKKTHLDQLNMLKAIPPKSAKVKANDTFFRHWHMLQMIPRYPSKIVAKDLRSRLEAENFIVDERTIQRNLKFFKDSGFPIECDDRDKPYGWSWNKDVATFNLPGLSNSDALTFNLVERHLSLILPAFVLEKLQPIFKAASEKLEKLPKNTHLPSWMDKVRVISPSQRLLSPNIDSDIHHTISESLLKDQQIKANYQKPGENTTKEHILHPLALVESGQTIYLVCKSNSHERILNLPLHRFKSAEMLYEPSQRPVGFTIDGYIASGGFGFGGGSDTIHLEAIFTKYACGHLYDTPLSLDQTITLQEDGRLKITATVVNTERLRWWLLNFGERVEVIAPKELRAAMTESANALYAMYNKN